MQDSQQKKIEGLKPNITQLSYNSNGTFSQSQNPIAVHERNRLKSGEYDVAMNRTQGQSSNRQAAMLPNIARNMIPAEKSSAGFNS